MICTNGTGEQRNRIKVLVEISRYLEYIPYVNRGDSESRNLYWTVDRDGYVRIFYKLQHAVVNTGREQKLMAFRRLAVTFSGDWRIRIEKQRRVDGEWQVENGSYICLDMSEESTIMLTSTIQLCLDESDHTLA